MSLVVSDDVLGARPLTGSIFNKEPKNVDVLSSDRLWYCESHGDHDRDAKLVESQVRVWSDHCSS